MKILLAGDSTVANYISERSPMKGWGESLGEILKDKFPKVEVLNFAKNGASTTSFLQENYFANLLKKVAAKDLVLFQFGHNDQAGVPMTDYYKNLQFMIHKVKEAGGKSILCTPVERRNFVAGKFVKTLGEYTPVLNKLAKEEEVPVFDLNQYTASLYASLGEKNSRQLFAHFSPSKNYPVGNADNTHFSSNGAGEIASYVSLRLKEYLSDEPLFDEVYYGACMYPELWDMETLKQDIKLMKKIGMNFARIGEFVWSSLEPEEGHYDFSLLENSLKLYQENGIAVCLCVPTPTPPRWMSFNHEERLIKNIDDTVMVHGSRQQVCTNNEYFRKKAYALTEKIGEIAEKYDNVIAIQLDNEFKCHVDLCFCDTCEKKWHEWLKNEYIEIENMNEAWGTKIWSEEYASFEEVVMPKKTPFVHNSSLMNAFRKFTAQTVNEFAHGLCDHLRMKTSVPITHNTAFGFNLLNEELFKDLDVVGCDTYPSSDNYPAFLLNMDTWRNMRKNTQEVLLLETSTSHVGYIENYVQPHPKGFVTTEVFTGFAGGLKTFSYWHFRGHAYGVEQNHSTVITSWGEPGMGYEEVVSSGELVEKMRPHLKKSQLQRANIGVVFSDDAKRVFNVETGGIYNYRQLISTFHASLVYAGINCELIPENADFSSYNVLFVPFVRNISKTMLEKIKAFQKTGGKLILGPMTGDRTEELTWPKNNGLGDLGEYLGLSKINQFVDRQEKYTLTFNGQDTKVYGLITSFTPEKDWKILGTLNEKCVMAQKDNTYYFGTLPKEYEKNKVWLNFLKEEILPLEKSFSEIVVTQSCVKYPRETKDSVQYYVANMGRKDAQFELKKPGKDLLTGESFAKMTHILKPYECVILNIAKEA